MLETVCPVEWRAARRRLCCVLLTAGGAGGGSGGGGGGGAVRALRSVARTAPDRAHYAYVYTHTQPHFVRALADGSGE